MIRRALTLASMSLIVSLAAAGCQKQIVLHPITPNDIYRIHAGDCNSVKDGWFLSDEWLKEVGKFRVEQ